MSYNANEAQISASQKDEKNALHWGAFWDVLLIVVVLVAVKQSLLPFTIKFAGPASTFSAMLFATWRLRARGMTWSDLGVRRPESTPKALLWAVFVLGLILLTSGLAGALADLFFEKQPKTNRFGDITGNWPAYFMYLGLIWTHAAIFEELLFRAFIINRLMVFFGGGLWATSASVILAAVFFGYRHYYYQGANGFMVTGFIGLSLGIYYVRRGKNNLWPQFLGHGFINTIGFTMRVLGIDDSD